MDRDFYNYDRVQSCVLWFSGLNGNQLQMMFKLNTQTVFQYIVYPESCFGVYSLFKMACMRECDMQTFLQIINPYR